MQNRITIVFSNNYLDTEAAIQLIYDCMDVGVALEDVSGSSRNTVAFIAHGFVSELSYHRLSSKLHRADLFARLMVNGKLID